MLSHLRAQLDSAQLLLLLVHVLLAISAATVTVAYYPLHGPALQALLALSFLWLLTALRNTQRSWRTNRRAGSSASCAATPAAIRFLAAVFLLYALVAVASAARVGFNPAALDRLEHFGNFLGAAALLPFLVTLRLRPDWFWLTIAATALLSGLFALWEMHTLSEAYRLATGLDYRAGGSKGKAIPFGDIATLTAALSALAGCVYWRIRPRWVWLFGIAALGGVYASLASGTRGAWIFLPTALVVIGGYLLQQYPARRRAILLAMLGLTLIGASALAQSDQLRERVARAFSEMQGYVPGASVPEGNSLGERFEMWRAAWMAFQEQPLLGIGVGQLNGYFKEAAKTGRISSAIADFDQGAGHTHAHNDYLHALGTRGLLGLGSLLLLYLAPLAAFVRASSNSSTRPLGYAGILVMLGYMQFSLTDSILLTRMTAGFFVLLCCWLLALTRSAPERVTGADANLARP